MSEVSNNTNTPAMTARPMETSASIYWGCTKQRIWASKGQPQCDASHSVKGVGDVIIRDCTAVA